MITAIIPTLNAAPTLTRTLACLVTGVAEGIVKEAIIADGGSSDETLEMAEAAGCDVVSASGPRAALLIAGAKAARAPWLLFLHPDVVLAPGWVEEVQRFLQRPSAQSKAAVFRFALDDDSAEAQRAAFWIRQSARQLKLPSGAQGLLISRRLYDIVGGYALLEESEDFDIARRIGGKRLVFLESEAVANAEAWRSEGFSKRALRDLGRAVRVSLGG